MKFKKFAVVFICIISLLSLFGCKTDMEKYGSNISELRRNVYEGGSENMQVTAITGVREDPYMIDGHCSGVRDFTVIKIVPKEFIAGKIYTYVANIDGAEYTGEFRQHPFGKSFSADIQAACNASSITLSVSADGASEEFTLISVVTEDMISAEKALEIATGRLKSEVSSLTSGGRLCAEIYIRLMANPVDNSGAYHWYVAFVGESQITYAALIEPVTMEIVAVRD